MTTAAPDHYYPEDHMTVRYVLPVAWLGIDHEHLLGPYCDVTVIDPCGNIAFWASTTVLALHEGIYPNLFEAQRQATDILREAGWRLTRHPLEFDLTETPVRCHCENGCDNWSINGTGAAVTVERM